MDKKNNRIYTLSICLSDIPAHKIVKASKDDKLYCEMVVSDKKEQDQYGYDAKVYCKQTKEEQKDQAAKKAYCGRGKVTQFKDDNTVDEGGILRNRIYTINVCLSDIPHEAIKVWDKEGSASFGKAYIDLCLADKKEVDKYGYDAAVYVRQSKEEREAGKDRVYCGRGKMDVYGNSGTPIESNPWAVGNTSVTNNADAGSTYMGSGFKDENNVNNEPFFGNNVGKDDLPF